MHAPHGGLWIFYFWRVLLHGLAFAAIGPAIGLIFSPGVILFPLTIFWAYYVSAVSAFVAGCCIGVASSYLRKPDALYLTAAVVGAICGALPVVMFGGVFAHAGMAIMYAFSGAAAAVVCTYQFRRMRLHPDNPRWQADR
ncbi:MAG TPA: hypothetical protein PLN33_14225 [Hyphomonadaceae bacterium]|nr:hypothetical protein [Hyphomonadaceae bacterium]HPN04560.1 hypothetical protein [Hyphomonadaceae bacterium]